MTRWIEWIVKKPHSSLPENEDIDHQDINGVEDSESCESPNIRLLFPKESPTSSRDPLFPIPQRNLFIMTCKRTALACRGVCLFGFVIFLVISFVASNSDSDVSDSSSGSNESNVEDDILDDLQSENFSANENDSVCKTGLRMPLLDVEMQNKSEICIKFNAKCGYKTTDYGLIAESIRKGVKFYEKNLDKITVLDAALGAKIVAEQLKIVLTSHQHMPPEILLQLRELSNKAENLSSAITQTVKRVSNNTEDLKRTLPWLEVKGLWDMPLNGVWYKVGQLEAYEPPEDEEFENLWNIIKNQEVIGEKESDACIYQAFHCNSEKITNMCHSKFLTSPMSMYSLTHQVIYMLLARKNKCYEQADWSHVPVLENRGDIFMEKLCGKVWQEANSIAEANFPPRFRDLFIEQIGMCSLAGYTDFLQKDWLHKILSWQSSSTSGCFKLVQQKRRLPTMGMLIKQHQRRQNQQPSLYAVNDQHRHKRSDVYIQDEDKNVCSVHFTSVGISALSLHLRYLFDVCLDNY